MKITETTIRELLEKYEAAETSLAEDQKLKYYFETASNIPKDLEVYQCLFIGFEAIRQEMPLPQNVKKTFEDNTSTPIFELVHKIAAIVIVAIVTSIFVFNTNKLSTKEEQEARAALSQTITILNAVSAEINQNTSKLNYVNQFNTTKNQFLK